MIDVSWFRRSDQGDRHRGQGSESLFDQVELVRAAEGQDTPAIPTAASSAHIRQTRHNRPVMY